MQQAVAAATSSILGGRSRPGDGIFAFAVRAAGVFVLLVLGSLIVSLLIGGLPALRQFGLGFLFSAAWDPVHEVFGAAVSVYGTLLTSILALLFAVPIAFGIAFYLTELAPKWLRRPSASQSSCSPPCRRSSTACGASSSSSR